MGLLLTRHYTDNKGATKKVAPSPSVEKKTEEKKVAEKSLFSADDIKAMNGTKIRKLAKENGIQNPEDLTVGELKEILCEQLVK